MELWSSGVLNFEAFSPDFSVIQCTFTYIYIYIYEWMYDIYIYTPIDDLHLRIWIGRVPRGDETLRQGLNEQPAKFAQ